MKEGAERIQPESNEPRQPEARESAEISYIDDFAEYSAIPGGHLTREEYERVTKAAEEPNVKVNEVYAINAKTYAGQADITLSPESLILYSVLRSDRDISSELFAERSADPRRGPTHRGQSRRRTETHSRVSGHRILSNWGMIPFNNSPSKSKVQKVKAQSLTRLRF
ncbi:MAG: hypothetical protein Q8L52_01925 [bacterium]|nr:hypothetical protein [bacterium]